MEKTINLSFGCISKLIEEYYKKNYSNYGVSCYCRSARRTKPDGYGTYDEYYEFSALVVLSVYKTIFGAKTKFEERQSLNHKEVVEILKTMLNEELEAENTDVEVGYIKVDEALTYVTLKEKEKKVKKLK